MPTPAQSLYAIDPSSGQSRLAIQVEPDGWLDEEVEPMLQQIVLVLTAARVPLALAVSLDSCFVLRAPGGDWRQLEIDEIETSEALSPFPLHPDPSRLMGTVEQWCLAVASESPEFMPLARLPRRVPEVVALLRAAELAAREGKLQLQGAVAQG